ncbi:MAG: DUF547 domain-containing protein [Proteobacteria bacterium]|nr:DUF547 domain-containing protein [Pseudomonadota bacterium]
MLPFVSRASAAGRAPISNEAFDRLLAKYVAVGADSIARVDYARWSASPADRKSLGGYIAALSSTAPSELAKTDLFAYWANLYNAITLDVVLDRYPVASIRDIKSDEFFDPKSLIGPWRSKRVTVEGRRYSLDDIEHVQVRPKFNEPRTHYAFNCASIGCPNLQPKAWNGATLAADLDNAARSYINHPRGVTALGSGRLKVSSIYKWFAADFEPDGGVTAHLRKYARPELAAAIDAGARVVEDGYDWSLNEAASRR